MYVIGEEGLIAAPARRRGVKIGRYRSKFESIVAEQLETAGCPYHYEEHDLYYVEPAKVRRYKPDILLVHNGIFIEVKGMFSADDRKKMLLVKDTYPEIDLRLLFMRSQNKLSKKSKTTYAQWCEKNGFEYADLQVPASWIHWTKTKAEKKAIADILKNMSRDMAIERYRSKECTL